MKPNLDFKKAALQLFLDYFERELRGLIESARAAHQAATHEESRAEDRHDTFAIEASYLAAGQAARVADLQNSVKEVRGFLESLRELHAPMAGALVQLECEGRKTYSLLATYGGGAQVQVQGRPVQLLSPSSPLGEHLSGLKAGDDFAVESKAGDREYVILSIC